MTKVIELRPEKNLLNPSFEKYQFSTDEIPITSEIILKQDVYRLELGPNQESLLEARLFAFHNHLFNNPYDGSCWFLDKNWTVWKLMADGSLEEVYVINNSDTDLPNMLYNPSIGFTNNNIAVISDGGERLTLLMLDQDKSPRSFGLSNTEPGVILDVRYVPTTSKIIVALSAIKSNGDKKASKLLLLHYTWRHTDDTLETFEFTHKENLIVRGAIEYVHIEETGQYLHSLCQDHIVFDAPEPQELDNDNVDKQSTSAVRIPKYCWSQNNDSLTVWIKIEKEQQEEIKVRVTATELSVLLNEKLLIEGECQHRLDETLTTWKYENDTFRLELVKFESGLMWSELIKGDTGGECLVNEPMAAEIHSRLAHLCTDQNEKLDGEPCIGFNAEQLEECDLEGRDNLLQRIHLISKQTTHLVMLGANNHVLFTYKTKLGQIICLRHDHDGCVWLTRQEDDTEWNMKHVCTFPGFGYVEASKNNKKFCVSPADGSYVAILEHTRHILVYKKPDINAKIAKQWIIDLGCEKWPIMGAVATNKYLIVLTQNKLYRLKIYA